MDSIIPLGQKNTLAEYMILSDANNRPPMLDKDLYDSWKSQMELNMQNREHGRMILKSVENGLLIKPTIEANVQPAYPYQSQMNHQTLSVPQINNQSPQVTTQPMNESPLIDSGFAIQVDMQRLLNITIVKVKDIWLGVLDGQVLQKIIPNNAAFQTEDLDTYDSVVMIS
uniref:Integrase, catalytic region, zinc finger, CCHC-type, peptidase aspartic, catalytic n=1 Tax=Tanacetum cinerariifolium TaxID=118510 RepID=A0A6L2NCF5_TANCI|nr:hypothetical protein [Tanacetum cinerariifolium]